MQAHKIEELSLVNWPAIQEVQLDGWSLRTANGYTKRANCVSSLHLGEGDIDEKIKLCEDYYHSLSQATIFKLTPFSNPALDEKLEKRNYNIIDPSFVLSMPLNQFRAAPLPKVAPHDQLEIVLYEHISLKWIEQFIQISGAHDSIAPTLIDIMAAMQGQLIGCSYAINGEAIATGFAVVDQGFVSFYNVYTSDAHRNRGFAGSLLTTLIEAAMKKGAHSSYIAVLANNEAANHLYKKLGFVQLYQYWYRVKEQ